MNFTDFERRLDTIYVVHKGVETIQYERINFRFAVPCNFLIKSLMLGTLTPGHNRVDSVISREMCVKTGIGAWDP